MKDFKERNDKISLISLFLFWFPLGIVSIFAILNIIFSGMLVTRGEDMKQLERVQAELHSQQKQLQEKLAQHGSLHILKEEAKALGYIPVTQVLHAQTSQEVAAR